MNLETASEQRSDNTDCRELDLEAMVELRPLPAVAMRISQACSDQQFDTKELTTLVECDPAFAAKILSVVNSSMYGFSREVSSIKAALVVMGRKNIAQLAVSIAAQKVFSTGDVAKVAKKTLYRHSLGCAAVCRCLANEMVDNVDSGEAFLAGMLHDVGKLVLLDLAPDDYSQLLETGNAETSSVEFEMELFGTDHTAIGTMFGTNWGLSAPICDAITNHHEQTDLDDMSLTAVTRLGNELCKTWGIGQSEQAVLCEDTLAWMEKSAPDDLDNVRTISVDYFKELSALLGS